MPKIFLIDGHNLIFRMYYALMKRPMINSKGVDTTILYGFTKYIFELLNKEKPEYLSIAFDPPGGTFRNRMYEAYKANRSETPQQVINALEPLVNICGVLGISTVMVPDYEADDVIGTIAKRCATQGLEVYMVTPDKDYGQLVDENISQWRPGKAGASDEVYGPKEICEKYGISTPSQVIEILTLCGDTADNVPGVKGVGEVGAGKLIGKYGTVDNIYAHIDELTPRQKEMFEEAREHLPLSHDLVTIRTDVPVDMSLEKMRTPESFTSEAAALFKEYEFPSLMRYLGDVKPSKTQEAKSSEKSPVYVLSDEERVIRAAEKSSRLAISCEGSRIFSQAGNLTVASVEGETLLVCKSDPKNFRQILENPSVSKYGVDLKLQTNLLDSEGIALNGRLMDISLMHYLIDPEKSHKLETLALSYLGIDLDESSEDTGDIQEQDLFSEIAQEQQTDKSLETAVAFLLGDCLEKKMLSEQLLNLYDRFEMPLIKVLARMERTGVKMDFAALADFAATLRKEVAQREASIRQYSQNKNINPSSPKQVGELLFEELKLDPKAKKSAKGSWSTSEEVLSELLDTHPVVGEILEYRAAKKLLSTYIEPFPSYVEPSTGKIHTTFNQSLTATGRLSSSNPNLQNIPIRTERGKEIRKAFVSGFPDGGVIMSADYSQIELRIMAHMSCDAHLQDSFRKGLDIHAATAAKIFGIPVEEVTQDQRRIAKTANFGIMYGISAFGLAQRLRLGRSEAKKIIDDYFAAFPSIRTFIDDVLASARENGYVETLFDRRRYIPEITSGNAVVRGMAERNAVNAPIQGTSADIIKRAMIEIDEAMQNSSLRSRMILQIHDELVFDVHPDEIDQLKALVVEKMENVVKLSIPLSVECNYGKNWLEAH